MIIAILLYRIDTSRLRFTAFDNKVDIIDIINIEKKKLEERIELSSLMYEIKVLTIKLFKLIINMWVGWTEPPPLYVFFSTLIFFSKSLRHPR